MLVLCFVFAMIPILVSTKQGYFQYLNRNLISVYFPTVNHELIPLVRNEIPLYRLREATRELQAILILISELTRCELITLSNKLSTLWGLWLIGIDG